MKKPMIIAFLSVVLVSMSVTSVCATASIETSIGRGFYVSFEFTNIPTATYDVLRNNVIMNETTIPETIYRNLADNGLVRVQYSDASIDKNESARSIVSTFTLRGLDVITSTLNRAALKETFNANTTWRKFNLNVIPSFAYNFTNILSVSLSDWNKTTLSDGKTDFSFTNTAAGVTCSFRVSKDAVNIYEVGEVIIFDLPFEQPLEDKIINSPILILIALAIVGLIVFVYRKIR